MYGARRSGGRGNVTAAQLPTVPALARLLLTNVQRKYQRFTIGLRKVATFSVAQLLLVGGCAATSYGFWLMWHPAGFIVGGWMAVKLSILWADDSLER